MNKPVPFSMSTHVPNRKEISTKIIRTISTVWPDIDYHIHQINDHNYVVTGLHDQKIKFCSSAEEANRVLLDITKGLTIKK